MNIAITPPKIERDLRVDLVRGLALFVIFIDHQAFLDRTGCGWLTAYTWTRYSFIDAADVFFFLSGFVSGFVYGVDLVSRGLGHSIKRALSRCLQLYVAEITL